MQMNNVVQGIKPFLYARSSRTRMSDDVQSMNVQLQFYIFSSWFQQKEFSARSFWPKRSFLVVCAIFLVFFSFRTRKLMIAFFFFFKSRRSVRLTHKHKTTMFVESLQQRLMQRIKKLFVLLLAQIYLKKKKWRSFNPNDVNAFPHSQTIDLFFRAPAAAHFTVLYCTNPTIFGNIFNSLYFSPRGRKMHTQNLNAGVCWKKRCAKWRIQWADSE